MREASFLTQLSRKGCIVAIRVVRGVLTDMVITAAHALLRVNGTTLPVALSASR